ncbi:hypothetical protein FFI89_018885 [Bradyrhizobium sp. KBS0727]|uniref:hypothetical protein n=1 Tax=unclassified Bradyrhizobium TaxID=2631580 RepID=UPI00110E30AF|nr:MULTISPECIES: hypothetical protein [unclassified Bradyrhizobium]QDW39032.1 hypothetical protein FFI71_018885 [Bradyrhizobium sp. KBS0725]QDW45635.1 hypothetical protein FFI89_018885 [Bradyrhizobium sp. KBS0727]
MSKAPERLSNRQIATMKLMAVCGARGDPVRLTRDQREAMTPLWRRSLVEIWWRRSPTERALQGPFFRLTEPGRTLILSILAAKKAA